MKNFKIFFWSVKNSLGAFLYILGVAWLMFNGERIFGKATSFWMPVALLLLFVLSATIVGLLVLGRPIYLYLNGLKSEGIRLLFYTVGWLFVIMLIVFLIQFVI